MDKNSDIHSRFINSIEEPALILSPDAVILDLNIAAEIIFKTKKNLVVGKKISVLCQNIPTDTKQFNFGGLVSHIEEKTITWHSICSKSANKIAQYILVGSIVEHGHEFSLVEHIANKTEQSAHENISKILTGKFVNIDKITFEHIKDIYLYMENIIAEIPVSVYWMSKDYIYLGCSNSMAKLLKLKSRRDIVGKTYADLYDEKSSAHYKKADRSVMNTGISLSLEEPLYSSDGSKKIYLSNKVPLRDSNGVIIGMLGISVDITDRKKMEEDLRKAKEAAEAAANAKTEFLANMSHDLRTPLTGVVGMSELLEDELQDPGQKEEAHMLHDSGEELLTMLNDILDDIQAGNLGEGDVHEEPFNLNTCVLDLVKLEKPTTTLKDLGLYVEIVPDVPSWIISDRKKIHRTLLNLVGNAIKFTKSGRITIKINAIEHSEDKVHLHFSVSDTGIGIPKEIQDKVFDRFFRATPSYKGLYTGHGLGLHIAQSYVNILGGHITLTSEEGKGTTFSFNLWCTKGEEIKTPTFSSIASQSAHHTSHSNEISNHPQINLIPQDAPYLLLVEDSPTALKVLQALVTKAGCRSESAINGELALELAKSNSFDLIITDVGLPGISGHELTQRIRNWEKSKNKKPVPIVGLTGHASHTSKKECIESGMDDSLTKPASFSLLQDTLKRFVRHSSTTSAENTQDAISTLGFDLPSTTEELFVLDAYPIFNAKTALEQAGDDESLMLSVMHDFADVLIGEELPLIQKAYSTKDWATVEYLVHKMKGGVVYCGTPRLKLACQYLERYHKAGHVDLLERLYQQFSEVIKETQQAIKKWLKDNGE